MSYFYFEKKTKNRFYRHFLIDIDQQYVINFSDFKSLNNRKDKESRKITEKVSLILIVSISISVNAD